MKIRQFEFNLFGVNTYVVYDEESHEAIIIDPGMSSQDERNVLAQFVTANNLKVIGLINTHLHLDHVFGNDFVRDTYNVKLGSSFKDTPLGRQVPAQMAMFHLSSPPTQPQIPEIDLKDGDDIKLGESRLKALAVPGHSPGSLALYSQDDGFVITGDALFAGSIGRTDLAGGNHSQLVDSISDKLMTLPDDTIVYPGHGPATTIGRERRQNPFLQSLQS